MDDIESNTLTESLLEKKKEGEGETEAGGATEAEGISFVAEEAELMASPETEFGSSSNANTNTNTPTAADASPSDQAWERGERQPPKYRDLPYAIAFHIQFTSVIILACVYAKSVYHVLFSAGMVDDDIYYDEKYSINSDGNSDGDGDGDVVARMTRLFRNSILFNVFSSLLLITASFAIMTKLGSAFITCSVWTQVVFSSFMAVVMFLNNVPVAGALFAFSAFIGACYAWTVKRRIPFAAANLKLGTEVIQRNVGVFILSLASGVLMFGWWILWFISLLGVTGAKQVCHEEDDFDGGKTSLCSIEMERGGFILPWILFLFWTQQVAKNVIHTITAGIAATWYFCPDEARGCFSPAVRDSSKRALTQSFGSICLGSLLVATIQLLDYIVQNLRRQRSENGEGSAVGALFLCCLDCILQLIQSVMEYFNKWAFIYVGIYGYPYMDAGKRVSALFTQRGWTVVINDHLVSNALGLMSFTVALLSATITSFIITAEQPEVSILFFINWIISLSLALTMMTIIDSAVSSIIVCFAEAPQDLRRNHPTHHQDMIEAWNKVYPTIRC